MILLNRKIHNVVENHTIEIHIRQGMTVNPGLNYFKQCSLACMCLLVNLHLRLHFAFRQSKAMLPLSQFTKYMIRTFCKYNARDFVNKNRLECSTSFNLLQ